MDVDRFVEDCLIANQESDAQAAVREVLAKAVSTPNAVISALGEPENAGLNVLLSSSTLTIFAATWTPQMNLMPHDHLMWANIGIYTGREDNIFWERSADGIKASGAEAYGGDFFDTTRSQWNPETLEEEPSDGAVIRGIFQRENERLGLGSNS
jgi:hypothetical protein